MILVQPQTNEDFLRYYNFRWQMLRQPWKQPEGSEKDQHENEAIHLMALDDDSLTLLGVARLHVVDVQTMQLRFMAVKPTHQRRGIASEMIRYLEHQAINQGKNSIVLNARENSLNFYQAHDYRALESAHTLYGEIKHWQMIKSLREHKQLALHIIIVPPLNSN